MKRKICVVITARPSYSRIKTALKAIKSSSDLELQLIVAGSALLDNYGNAEAFITKEGFEIKERVFMVLEGGNLPTMAKTTGLGLIELATAIHNLSPQIVITIADRYETMATALAASYMNIPLAHVQGGEVTGSIDEKVRHSVTKLSNLHFVCTKLSAERVIKMGEEPSTVHVTGCPSIDLAANVMENPALDFDPIKKYGGVGAELDLKKGYIVVMQHPVTTEYKEARQHITETIMAVHDLGLPALWFWPNPDAGTDGTSEGIRSYREKFQPKNVHFFKHMGELDFLRLILNSRCLIGNSSVGIRESAFLGVPTVNIGTRQQGRERAGNVIDVPYDRLAIRKAIDSHIQHGRFPSDHLYGDGKAGERIADLLVSCPLTIEKRLTY